MGEVSYFEARRRLLLRAPRLAMRLFVATQTQPVAQTPSVLGPSHD